MRIYLIDPGVVRAYNLGYKAYKLGYNIFKSVYNFCYLANS